MIRFLHDSRRSRLASVVVCALAFAVLPREATADEIWVAPTSQQDLGGMEIASSTVWPVTPVGAVRFAFAVPADLEQLQSAKVVLIPGTSSGVNSSTLTIYACEAFNGSMAGALCSGPSSVLFTRTANQLQEIDISAALAGTIGIPGIRPYLALLAFTTPTTAADHFVGLRLIGNVGVRIDETLALTVLGKRAFGNVNGAGADNTAVGFQSMQFGWKGGANTALGSETLVGTQSIDSNTGSGNTAIGYEALNQNIAGSSNVAVGMLALRENTTGTDNVAIGARAISGTGGGQRNIAIGSSTLTGDYVRTDNVAIGHHSGRGGLHDTSLGSFTLQSAPQHGGNDSIAIGYRAGFNSESGSFNIHIGNEGLEEWNTLRLGTPFNAIAASGQNRAFVAGIRGTTTDAADAVPVVVDSNGQLGTISSSRRFKEDINDMTSVSRRLFDLRPVTFRYAKPYTNGSKPLQFGLVAEEVAEVFPELAVRDASGNVETVHYETLSVLLLNEMQKQEKRIESLEERLNALSKKNQAKRPAAHPRVK